MRTAQASVNSLVADRTQLWWNLKRPDDRTLWESKIELGEKFFEEIIRHPVPLDMNTLKSAEAVVPWASTCTCGWSTGHSASMPRCGCPGRCSTGNSG